MRGGEARKLELSFAVPFASSLFRCDGTAKHVTSLAHYKTKRGQIGWICMPAVGFKKKSVIVSK